MHGLITKIFFEDVKPISELVTRIIIIPSKIQGFTSDNLPYDKEN